MRTGVILAASLVTLACLPAVAQPAAPTLAYVQPLPTPMVQSVQDKLRLAGTYSGRIDGIWGTDSQAALEFLTKAFGFDEVSVHRAEDGSIGHAMLRLGAGMIMFGGPPQEEGWLGAGKPDPLAGTVSVYVVVADPRAHYEHAARAGATIVRELERGDLPLRLFGRWALPSATTHRELWLRPIGALGRLAALAAGVMAVLQALIAWPTGSVTAASTGAAKR